MTNATLKIITKDYVVDAPFGFNFRKHLKLKHTDFRLFCAEFDPPLNINEELITHVNFTDLDFLGDRIHFSVSKNYVFQYYPRDAEQITIKLINPVPVPQDADWNSELFSNEELILAHVFFLPHLKKTVNDLEFMNSLQSKWSGLLKDLKNALKRANKGLFGLSIGIVKDPGLMPELIPAVSFFDSPDSFELGDKITIIVISSFEHLTFRYESKFVSVKNVPRIPKDIIFRIRAQTTKLCPIRRRIIKACLNGAVPVQLIDALTPKIPLSGKRKLKSEDFEQIDLCLGDFERQSGDVITKLTSFLEDLKDHLFTDSSEAALRLLFWDPVINRMIQHGSEGHPKNYKLEPEWSTKALFDEHDAQKIDHTVTFELRGITYPMLLIEIGKEPFDLLNPHKYQSKMHCILSQLCTNQARALIAANLRPELARACGIWIDGLKIQLLVAHPVITKLPGAEQYEIHVNITMNSHWLLDLNFPDTTGRNCRRPCCKVPETEQEEIETIISGKLDVNTYPFMAILPEDRYEDSQLADPKRAKSSIASRNVSVGMMVGNNINVNVLKKLNVFIQYVKSRINLILSPSPDAFEVGRKFKDKGPMGMLIESRASTHSKSPSKGVLIFANTSSGPTELSRSPSINRKRQKRDNVESFSIVKQSLKELDIILKLAMFPTSFPVVFDYQIISEGHVQYEFEELQPIFDPMTASMTPVILHDAPLDTLFGSLNFAVESLYALYLLHEVVGVVHSDVSLSNIMFSPSSSTWKIIDFDQSLEIYESMNTPRVAGTPGYIAPESLESGIFTKESDVFSIGTVFVNLFDFLILNEICINDDEDLIPDKFQEIGEDFCTYIRKMASENPFERPTALQALIEIFSLFENFNYYKDIPIYAAIRMLLEKQKGKQLKREASVVNILESSYQTN